jgi:hypothetical protein
MIHHNHVIVSQSLFDLLQSNETSHNMKRQ